MKIMVVDDDPVVLDSCRRILEAGGFEVSLFHAADKALEAMHNDTFDLLLIDVKMPDRDGIYLMGEINKKWSTVPIVSMSGYPVQETIVEGVKMGVATFIAKPFTPDELLQTIRWVLQKEKNHETDKSSGH